MHKRTFVGFGFGPIQAGLFLYEAFRSGNFSRLVVAEVVPELVDAVRAESGNLSINIARQSGIDRVPIHGVEILNPTVPKDRAILIEAIADSSEIATALPSVRFYDTGKPSDVAAVLAEGFGRKAKQTAPKSAVIYTAENNNHAAEILDQAIQQRDGRVGEASPLWQSVNTVIGKMSGLVGEPKQIREQNLATLTTGMHNKAFLVEAFNRILISPVTLPGFQRGITAFEEKPDLIPFEEAKLYGHNATHALLGYLLRHNGKRWMSDAAQMPVLLSFAREAFLEESGHALCRKHRGVDPLFTLSGYEAYADDLLTRMLNPWLRDQVDRVTRDPARKLAWDDRLVGTMRMALQQDIRPWRYATATAAAALALAKECGQPVEPLLRDLWKDAQHSERQAVTELVLNHIRGDSIHCEIDFTT
jgi:mannitol-1-phosphate 5-dehydrogenase